MKMNNGYIAFYEGNRKEIYAETLYAAKKQAIAAFKVKPKNEHKVHVHLAEIAGKPVTHVADF